MWETKKVKASGTEAEHFTVLGKDVTFKGIVQFHGTVQIDSCFEGEIHTTGVLVVGEHAVIRGIITAGTLISSGTIHGTVTAAAKVQLLKSAVQLGDVQAPALSVEEGAYFRGYTDMGPRATSEDTIREMTAISGQDGWPSNHALALREQETGGAPLDYEQVQDALIQEAHPR